MAEVNMRHVRTEEQRALYEKISESEKCSFCEDFCRGKAPTFHPNPVLFEEQYWVVTECFPKLKSSKEGLDSAQHFLLVYREHVTCPPLPPKAWANLGKCTERLMEEYRLPAETLVMRMGDGNFTGGSIAHLHAQLIFGGATDGDAVRVKVGYAKV